MKNKTTAKKIAATAKIFKIKNGKKRKTKLAKTPIATTGQINPQFCGVKFAQTSRQNFFRKIASPNKKYQIAKPKKIAKTAGKNATKCASNFFSKKWPNRKIEIAAKVKFGTTIKIDGKNFSPKFSSPKWFRKIAAIFTKNKNTPAENGTVEIKNAARAISGFCESAAMPAPTTAAIKSENECNKFPNEIFSASNFVSNEIFKIRICKNKNAPSKKIQNANAAGIKFCKFAANAGMKKRTGPIATFIDIKIESGIARNAEFRSGSAKNSRRSFRFHFKNWKIKIAVKTKCKIANAAIFNSKNLKRISLKIDKFPCGICASEIKPFGFSKKKGRKVYCKNANPITAMPPAPSDARKKIGEKFFTFIFLGRNKKRRKLFCGILPEFNFFTIFLAIF